MNKIQEIQTLKQWEEIYMKSSERIAIILKYNEHCVICQRAYSEFEKFYSQYDKDSVDVYIIDVVRSKPVSKQVANDLEVTHQSPQLIIMKDFDSVWCDNHKSIELKNIQNGSRKIS
ncbi:bacillithiol system redox-active protein YtxJ [Alkalihalobacillus sp. 1P02AB]|uniref:bacillithiol system redox-active protein YtxJ n=1 Tax=Alkalihalobacillus sp. 1P02AB TaxID=3132260 RepID=UPI0039A4D008